MASGLLVGANGSGSGSSTTKAAVSDGTITIRDQANQTQDVADMSRDVENANQTLSPIFDKEKEQQRLQEAQKIGEIAVQAMDIAATQGKIIATHAANDKITGATQSDRDKALAELKKQDPSKQYDSADIEKQVYQNFYNQALTESQLGTGGKVQQAMQAATAAVQGLAGGNIAQAIAGGAAGDSAANAVAGAQAGKNAIENNALGLPSGLQSYGVASVCSGK
ncbi:putative filamentous hemagglutinin [Erwinia piriflorinigrans CFBP 5888]|uniref:Putative filamentous hemagglutinin n=1 Tax=Erwinia piriflorinigrans CFBP 5888 TaxID=1161919 RepID=V5Z470_9GAMM|nr:putative filamentous hemagglutinin [Erwinia piriflorinigrans CFBP 5888]